MLPARWAKRLSRKELDYSKRYGNVLGDYMKAIDLDLTADVQPPKHLHVHVRVKRSLGEVMLPSGVSVKMTPGSTLLLRRSDVEQLVRRGALEEIPEDD